MSRIQLTPTHLSEWAGGHVGTGDEAIGKFLCDLCLGPPDEATLVDYYDWCTPHDLDVFAITDAEGAHFGTFEAVDGKTPVAMVSPAMVSPTSTSQPYYILGDSMWEFLCLGVQHGFYHLTELPFRTKEVIELYSAAPAEKHPSHEILKSLSDRFDLRPWDNIPLRLAELQDLYLDELEE